MEENLKQLLLKDLCGRLLYGVKVELHEDVCTLLGYFNEFVMLTANVPTGQQTNVSNIKLYLRPMSSMTEEEEEEWWKFKEEETIVGEQTKSLDWLNTHHFDYRGLIPKGLALEAPEGMYNFKTTCNNCEDKNYCSQSEYVKNNCYKLK